MAPSRKKGGGKAAAAASARRQWKVGDLVLAKVKGFPAWPAAVSEPEKWGYSADCKKILVHFFGTQQIAFCNPADVESFTEEKKQSLLTKRHAKGSDFVRAVKEITESYEKMKQQDEANDSKSAEETIVGSSRITIELPQACETLISTRLDTQIGSNSSHGTDESALLSEDASAAEQMLALRHNSQARNGACDNAAAKDLCEIATYSSRRRNERARSQKCAPQEIILPVQHSDTVGEVCERGQDLNKGLDFQISTMVKRKKRKPTRKRETSDLDRPSAKVESEEGFVTKACDSGQGSQSSHETLNERPCAENGDEHLPLVKRARVRMSRAFYADEKVNASSQFEERSSKDTPTSAAMQTSADEKVNASSQFEERSSKDTPTSAAMQTSPSVNHENDIVSGQDTSAAKEFNSFDLSCKLPGDMVDLVSSHMEKPSGRMSPSRACVQTVGNTQTAVEFHENYFSMTPYDEATRVQSNQLGSTSEGNTRVSEVVQGCSEESQTMNCLNFESDPIDMQCTRQSEKNRTPLNPDTMDLSENNPPCLSSGLDMTVSWVPAQSPHQLQSQDNDFCDHSLVVEGDSSLKEKRENIDNMTQGVQSQAVEHSPLFCSVVSNQEAENRQDTENTPLKQKQGSLGKEFDSGKQAHIIQNPAPSATERYMIVKEAESQYRTVYSHCEDAVENKEMENSCEADEQKEQIETTNSVSVSENLSREKISLSPDSPGRGTPHSNSVCHMSTVESANNMQNNSYRSTSVQFGEKRNMSDDTVKEERKVEIGVTQVKKVVSSDVQFIIESFETALGSLVRTKETIGRATRLAMDLVKFGASAKAMEILAHTLESESNLQRRVDLFFLVDSIAQCSKGLNGDAGGVYLSSIQVMLPRLLAAAVPAGATTQENRRQCLKVLRLWLERRILPESIVRHHIRELDSHSNVSAFLYSRRSARTERSLDDPVRDMEGILVDEYGSNSTLQLQGFCMPAMLKVEDEGSDSDGGDFEPVTPEHESRIVEEHATPSITERHTCILEDVDGELEMEDVAPPWDVGSSAPTDQGGNTDSGTSHQNVTSSSPLAPPSQNAQCAMPDSYSNGFDCRGYPSMHGDHQAGIPRMNPPMDYRSPESSYRPGGESCNFQHKPYPPPPSSHHYYSNMEADHHIKLQRREGPSYPHRSHYEERNYHDRMRPPPCESRDNWRYHPPSSHGPHYNDRHKGPYQSSSSYHRDSGRFQNHRWSNRHSFHYKPPHSEGPVSSSNEM